MPEASRASLRALGQGITDQLGHGTPAHRSRPLYQGTLPGLGDYTREALWGSVWARPGLVLRDRMLATLTVLASLQRLQQLRTYLHSALNLGVDAVEVHEVLIQCSVHGGFPVTVNTMEVLREVLEARGVTTTMPEVPEVPVEELDRRGRQLHLELFGVLPEEAPEGSVAAALGLVELRFAFGEILSRPGLDRRARVIVGIAASLALRDEPELARWSSAAPRVGLGGAERDEVVAQCAHYAGLAPSLRALRASTPTGS